MCGMEFIMKNLKAFVIVVVLILVTVFTTNPKAYGKTYAVKALAIDSHTFQTKDGNMWKVDCILEKYACYTVVFDDMNTANKTDDQILDYWK